MFYTTFTPASDMNDVHVILSEKNTNKREYYCLLAKW